MKEGGYFLTPIKVCEPPEHTKIKNIRCFTCKKFPVCNIRDDYLKTVSLIENIIGDPQEDRKLNWYNCKCGCIDNFYGYFFYDHEKYFPNETKIIFNEKEETGRFFEAKFRNSDFVQFIYEVNNYLILFNAVYNKDKDEYTISEGVEIFYKEDATLLQDDINVIKENLLLWREMILEKEKQEIDIINTTYFSAQLNCDFYEWEKGLTESEGIRRIIAEYPDGIQLKDGSYYHLATYHIEAGKIPCYHPQNGKVAFAPFPYPVYCPTPCKPMPRPPRRRGDINE